MKNVAITPAGRRRYMRILVPQILSCPDIDRYDIWVNTTDKRDLIFLNEIGRHEKVNLIEQPDGIVNGNASICAFFRHACDDDSIYIRFDDDVVWMERDTVSKLVEFRKNNPEYFLISPIVVNNAICTSILQKRGHLKNLPVVSPTCMDKVGWADPNFAYMLHKLFLTSLDGGDISEFKTQDTKIAFGRFSINCISWFGRDLSKYGGKIQGDDEEEMSVNLPLREGRANCFVGDTVVSHFSFFTQREFMDPSGLLDNYSDLLGKMDWIDPEILKFVERAYDIAENAEDVNSDRELKRNTISSLLDVQFKVPFLKFKIKTITPRKYLNKIKQRFSLN